MKRTLTLIALIAICSSMMVSCKNNSKKSQSQKPTSEEIQQQKQALVDTVLAKIDELALQYQNAREDCFRFRKMILTDEEKKVKPDYLLDPSVAKTLVTKSQKINALAIYIADIGIYKAYDMPYDDVRDAALKLAADLNAPFDFENTTSNEPVSKKMKSRYDAFRERGELSFFWQLEYAIVFEIYYIIANNPDLFFSKMTEEEYQALIVAKRARLAAIEELAKYDDEMAQVWAFRNKDRVIATDEERDRKDQSIESAKQYIIANKDKYIAKRNALLQ